jgi:hypothetical protein
MRARVAILTHGDRVSRSTSPLSEHRLRHVADAIREIGLQPELSIYNDDFIDEVKNQLLRMDAVLVWVNPIENGRNRTNLDAMLADVATQGVFVSAHPNTIQKMGTKSVLVDTKNLSWGSDVYLYTTPEELRSQLPKRLSQGTPRVLKQHRGHSGQGIWKVTPVPNNPSKVLVRQAVRGGVEDEMQLSDFLAKLEPLFLSQGCIIDQEFQPRLNDGTIRCYLVQDRIAGFGHQEINALYSVPEGTAPEDVPQPGQRLYFPPSEPQFQAIGKQMETEWLPAMLETLSMNVEELPLLWDADFFYGPKNAAGEDSYILCEINVSSVFPFPDSALEPLAQALKNKLVGV